MLRNQQKANLEYFVYLSAKLRQCSLEDQIRWMYKKRNQFLMGSPLKIVSSFLGASIAQISTYRNMVQDAILSVFPMISCFN